MNLLAASSEVSENLRWSVLMNNFRLHTVFFIILFNFPLIAQTNITQNETGVLKDLLVKWTTAFNNKDLNGLAAFYSQDYLGYYPGQPTQTYSSNRDQFERLFKNTFVELKISVQVLDCDVEGTLAVIGVSETSKVVSKYAKQPQLSTDTGLQVWKKQGNGQWMMYRSALYPLEEKKGTPKK